VARGDVLLAGVTSRARRIRAPRGWRLVRVDRGRRLTQAIFLRVAGTGGRATHSFRTSARAAAAGGIVAYRGADAANPLAGHAGRSSGRRMPAPAVTPGGVTVGFFGTDARARLTAPPGSVERYDVAARSVSSAAFDSTVGRSAAPRVRSRRRAHRYIAQIVVLRAPGGSGGSGAGQTPAGSGPGSGGGGTGFEGPGPGPGPGGGQASPLPESTGPAFYVSTTGSDSSPGTEGAPWRTIQKALDTLRPGERALVRGGTYVEDLEMDRAGTAANPISVEAYAGERPIIKAAGSHPVEVGSSGAYFRLRGFVIEDHPGTSGGNVDVYGHHVEISANEIRDSRDQGIYTSDDGSNNVYILGNWIHDNGEGIAHQSHGIYLQGADHFVANNRIQDHPKGFGIQVYDQNSRSTVVHNTIVESGYAGIVVGGSGGVDNIRIHNNILAFNDQEGVATDSTCPDGPVWIDHNVIFGNGQGPIEDGCDELDVSAGNREQDPRFVDLDGRDLHLQPASPAIDYASAAWARTSDHDGEGRPQGAGFDAGAFEDG